jgi:lactoylglutathione lyase
MRIDHVRLLVVNFVECFRFYRDIIGLNVLWGDEDDSYASFAEQGNKLPTLALFRRQAMADVLGTSHLPGESPSQDRSMLIIEVKDMDAVVQQFKSQGVRFVLEPQNFPAWGMRGAYLRDPDGNLIELTSYLAPENWTEELRQAAQKYAQT